MKIRLQVRTPDDSATTFEHAGPVVHVGRDPQCELYLQGEACQVVSRKHVRVELSNAGATVADAGSSNGTLLNGRSVAVASPLRVGDEIQLGQTGVTLRVLALDAQPQTRRPVAMLVGGGVAAAALLGLAVAAGFVILNRPPEEHRSEGDTATSSRPQPPATPPTSTKPAPTAPETPSQPKAPPPRPEPAELGRYVSLPGWPPSALLHREAEELPWVRLRPEERVKVEHTLVSLPGYRSVVALDGGVWLTLWGNLPEFSAFPPVLESVVTLSPPKEGTDLDLTLERGRIVLSNSQDDKPASVRLKFRGEDWLFTLPPGRQNETGVELWELPGAHPAASWCLGVFSHGGGLRVQTPTKVFTFQGSSRLTWLSSSGVLAQPEPLTQLPEWWSRPPNPRKDNTAADVLLSLGDWSVGLERAENVVDGLLTPVRESSDPTDRALGVLFLGALDEVGGLVEFLDSRHAEVRGTTATVLRRWLRRSPQHPAVLQRILRDKRNYPPDKAKLLAELLSPPSPERLLDPATYQSLIDNLDHDNLSVRDLAHWHLMYIPFPAGQEVIQYDPLAPAEKRREAIARWQGRVPKGSVPSEVKAALRTP